MFQSGRLACLHPHGARQGFWLLFFTSDVMRNRTIALIACLTAVGCATTPRPITIPAPQTVYAKAAAPLITAPRQEQASRPADVFPSTGGVMLPGGTIRTRGAVRAMVMSLSFGSREPAFSDVSVASWIVGSAIENHERGTAGALSLASNEAFRLDGSVFPHLVQPDGHPDSLLARDPSGASLAPLLRDAISHWSRIVNLGTFDNDGPDGKPQSGDDDGAVDLSIVVLETDSTTALARVDINASVPAHKDGSGKVRIPSVYVLAIPRSRAATLPPRYSLGLIMGALGVPASEAFFPASFNSPRAISTVARIELGWASARWIERSSDYLVDDDAVMIVPVVDVDNHQEMYLIERDGRLAYITHVVRLPTGRYSTVSASVMAPADADKTYLLTRSGKVGGPRMVLTWPAGGNLSANIALTSPAQSPPPAWLKVPAPVVAAPDSQNPM